MGELLTALQPSWKINKGSPQPVLALNEVNGGLEDPGSKPEAGWRTEEDGWKKAHWGSIRVTDEGVRGLTVNML